MFTGIIVAYHPEKKALSALLDVLPTDTIIVDNGRTLAQEDVGKATLITPSSNVGYAAGANMGMQHAIAHGAEWMVILNQDTVFTQAAVRAFDKQLAELEPCVAGPHAGGLDKVRWTTILPSMKADYITGSCMAVHKQVIEKIGYLYEPYFLYYEEADYCLRAKKAGFPMRIVLIPGIVHEESLSLGKGSPMHQYYLARNHLLFVSRTAPVRVRRREYLRLPVTISEHIIRQEYGAFLGVIDFLLRRFGKRRSGL